MKMKLVFALAAVLAAAPLVAAPAEKEKAKDEAAEQSGPTPEQVKARKAKRPVYQKFVEAKLAAEKCGQPMVVALLPDRSPAAQFLQQKVFTRKEFAKDFAMKNCVLLIMKLKVDSKDPKKIETRGLKEPETKFLENFAVTKRMKANAERDKKPEPKYSDSSCYPAVLCVDSACQKELFRLNDYDKEGGFGVWLSQVADAFRSAGIEPELSPLVTKIVENPDEPKKWK